MSPNRASRKRAPVNPCRRWTAIVGILALLLAAIVPWLHQPVQAGTAFSSAVAVDATAHCGTVPQMFMPGPDQGEDVPPPVGPKMPVCPVCLLLHLAGIALPPAADAFIRADYRETPVFSAPAPDRPNLFVESGPRPRAPPVAI